MKYIKVFENEEESDLRDKKLLDRISLLYSIQSSDLADLDFREGTSSKEYEFYVTSKFGEVGFHYEDFEISDYRGEGDWEVTLNYERTIGDTQYFAIAQGYGKAYHKDDLDEVYPTSLLRVYKRKIT